MAHQSLKSVLLLCILLFVLEARALDPRLFVAAPKHARLRRRDASFDPRWHQQSLVYADYSGPEDSQPSSALRLSLSPKKPVVILEDLIPHVTAIECRDGLINIYFPDLHTANAAKDAWGGLPEFLLITSEPVCAPYGEHAAFEVTYTGIDEPSWTISLTAERKSLRDCTHKMEVDLGTHRVADIHVGVFRRYAEPQQATSATTIYQTATLPLSTTLSFAPPTATASSARISGDVSFSRQNTRLFPPDSAIVDFVPQLQAIKGFELSCGNCSLQGQLQLQAAGFSINSSHLDQVIDFIDDGFFEFNAIGMAANMSFNFDFQPGFSVAVPFVPQLPEVQLTPFGIPGVVNFGPSLQLLFPMAITLNSPVRFSTGFTLAVPQNSTLLLNVSHVGSSYSRGFQDSVLTPLPFNVNADNLSLNFTAGFRPQLLLSPGLVSGAGPIVLRGGVGTFLDLPSYTATASAVKNKAENCEDPAPSNEENTRIHIEPSISVGGGVLWEFQIGIQDDLSLRAEGEEILIQTTRPLPTQCLLFDSKTSAIAQTTPSATGSGHHNAGNSGRGVFPGAAALVIVAMGVSILF